MGKYIFCKVIFMVHIFMLFPRAKTGCYVFLYISCILNFIDGSIWDKKAGRQKSILTEKVEKKFWGKLGAKCIIINRT